MSKPFVPKAILWGGLIAGTLDITAACLDVKFNFDKGPVWLLQNVASSLLGPASYNGGAATAVLGLAMHYLVACTATAVFYVLSRRFPPLVRWPGLSGPIYGAVVFLVMFRGIIPLTIALKSLYLTTAFNHNWPPLRGTQFFIHLVCVGLPIALSARRFTPVASGGYRA